MAEDKKPGSGSVPLHEKMKRTPSDAALDYAEKSQRHDVTNTRPAPGNPNGDKGKDRDK